MQELTKNLLDWFKRKADELKISRVALGISGGKDSTVVAGLGVAVFGKDNVFGLSMPNGVQSGIADAVGDIEHVGSRQATVDNKTGGYRDEE